MTEIVPEVAAMRQPRKTPADRAYLLRVIARTVTESLPAPLNIETSPECSAVSLRFDDDAVGAVQAWADMLGVDLVHEQVDSGWHWVGNDDAGTLWHGWLLHVWCKVNGPAQHKPAAAWAYTANPTPAATAAAATDRSAERPPMMWPAPGQDPALREDQVVFA